MRADLRPLSLLLLVSLGCCSKPADTTTKTSTTSTSNPPTSQDAPLQSMTDLETQMAAQTRQGMGIPTGASDFQIVVTEAQYPIGTVMRRGTTIPIDYTSCAPAPAPGLYPLPTQFPAYSLSRDAAASFGLDATVLAQIAGAGVKVNADRAISVTVADPMIEVLADHDLSTLVASSKCVAAIEGQPVWYVRGYIVARRTFSSQLAAGADANLKAVKVGAFDVSANGQNTVGISDDQPVGFLEVISEISPPPAPVAHIAAAHHLLEHPGPGAGGGGGNGVGAPGPVAQAAPRISAPTASTAKGRIYVQKDRLDTTGHDAVIIAALAASGLAVVPQVQAIDSSKMPAAAQVRYFNAADAPAATTALDKLKTIYPNAKLVLLKLPAPPGQFEVWLPRVG